MLAGNRQNRIQVADPAHEMRGDHGRCRGGDERLQLRRVHLEGFVHVAEYRRGAGHGHRHARGQKANGRADHLFARSHTCGHHGAMQRRGSATDGLRIFDAKLFAPQRLELFALAWLRVAVIASEVGAAYR